jgi:hypothetical protein
MRLLPRFDSAHEESDALVRVPAKSGSSFCSSSRDEPRSVNTVRDDGINRQTIEGTYLRCRCLRDRDSMGANPSPQLG